MSAKHFAALSRRAVPWLSTLLATLMVSTVVAAQETNDTLPRYHLEDVTVTTTRAAVDRSEITQKLEVVTSDVVEATAGTNVASALRRSIPIDVIEYPGLLAGISIRGFRPQYSGINHRTLVLVDGRPAGTSNLALIHPGDVQRIEVLRGPGAVLYGSNAMGGVVNVVTRHSTEGLMASGKVGYGSFGNYEAQFATGGSITSRLDFDATLVSIGQADGYSLGSRRTFAADSLTKFLPNGATRNVAWIRADSTIHFSEYGALSGRVRLGFTPVERWRVDLSTSGFSSDGVQNPGDLGVTAWDSRSLKDVVRRSFDVNVAGMLDGHAPSLRIFHTLESTAYYSAPVAPHYVNLRTPTRTWGAQVQDVFTFGANDFTFGIDYTAIDVESEAFTADGVRGTPYSPDSGIHAAAVLGQAHFRFLDRRLVLSAGGRADRVAFHVHDTPNLADHVPNSERHFVVTPGAGIRYTTGFGLQAYSNFGEAFVTPDAFNIAGYVERSAGVGRQAVFITKGNADLNPERSRTIEFGLALRRPDRGFDFDATYFHTNVRDRIVAVTEPAASGTLTTSGDTILATTTYVNADRAFIRGIEAEAGYAMNLPSTDAGRIRFFLSGTRLLRAEEQWVADGVFRPILNVADLTVIGGVHASDVGPVTGRLTARYVGERFDNDFLDYFEPGEILYPAHLVVDLTGTVRVANRYRVGIDLINLLDEDYFEVRGYNLPGRSVRLSVAASLR